MDEATATFRAERWPEKEPVAYDGERVFEQVPLGAAALESARMFEELSRGER